MTTAPDTPEPPLAGVHWRCLSGPVGHGASVPVRATREVECLHASRDTDRVYWTDRLPPKEAKGRQP